MNKCFIGDCRETMTELIAQGVRVQMCVTSPPYWGLRDYGHEGQLGLERDPMQYVAQMVVVFDMVRDLLAEDGTLWLNLGDSYSGGGGYAPDAPSNQNAERYVTNSGKSRDYKGRAPALGLKPKDLCGIPWRVAFALQADGWYLRQDIIWHKPSTMPESVTDRCTKAHEYIFLLAKRERYYFDNEAIKEPSAYPDDDRKGRSYEHHKSGPDVNFMHRGNYLDSGRPGYAMRNKRSVWSITNAGYSGAHFATFPPELIEPCILAGSRPGDIVLDPFFGSGTTGEVAQRLGRQWIGCELQGDYVELQKRRTAQLGMVLA